jgi:hypothetical protein
MAIQYPKLEHATLPSVEGFNGSLNILRDPPKSIFTKRIDKVGENNNINDIVDISGDRVNECILTYARGVNPMVSVSYNNNSNNAGSFTNQNNGYGNNINQGHHQGNSQAYLPYRIADKGAFRPPIRSQRDLLPLSRQPRAWFQALTNPGYIDYTKNKYLPTKFRMIRDILKTENEIKPNNSVKIEKPILNNMKMQNAINEKHINIEAFSGKRTLDYSNYTRENVDLYKGIQENYEQVNAITNKKQNISHDLSNIKIDENRYITEKEYYESNANPNLQNIQGLDGMSIDENRYISEKEYYESNANPNLQNIQGLNGMSIDENRYISEKEYYESNANPNLQNIQGLDGMSIDENRYISEKEYYNFIVNKGRDINIKSIDELNSNNKVSVKEILQYDKNSGKNTGYTLLTDIPDMELEKNIPYYSTTSSFSDPTVYKRVDHENDIELKNNLPQINMIRDVKRIEDMNNFDYGTSREYKLPETLQKGKFMNEGTIPTQNRAEIQIRTDSQKEKIRKYINNSQFSRFNY